MVKRDESTILIGDSQDDRPVQCPVCGWIGLFSDMRRRYVDKSWWKLKNHEGYQWMCPSCGSIVLRQYVNKK